MLDDSVTPKRALVAAVQTPDGAEGAFEDSLAELGRLAKTLGLQVVGSVVQKRSSFHPATYLGAGKVEELKLSVTVHKADVVLVDHEISPSQARNLEKAVEAEVMDRTAVILEIFHRHARSRTAKAQVEIVRLQYMAPRLREQGKGKDRQRGGIGAKGAGESSVELDRRKIRDRVAELTEELVQLETEASTQRARRRDLNRVALVGYTNAGKSTLMRALTHSDVYIADKLFATLDTTVRAMLPEGHPKVLISDTVGFIDNLPHGLVASFKSTLDEALEASLLLHVIDASDRSWPRQADVTDEVLRDIGAGDIPRLRLFNKIDAVGDAQAQVKATEALATKWPDGIIMSAREPEDIRHLREAILEFFRRDMVQEELRVPWAAQHLRGRIFKECEVAGERHDDEAVIFQVRASRDTLDSLRAAAAATGPDRQS